MSDDDDVRVISDAEYWKRVDRLNDEAVDRLLRGTAWTRGNDGRVYVDPAAFAAWYADRTCHDPQRE